MEQYILSIKKNMMCQDSNEMFNYRIKFKFNYKIYIKIMRCKIVRTQKLMWHNIIKSNKNKKVSILHYSIDTHTKLCGSINFDGAPLYHSFFHI